MEDIREKSEKKFDKDLLFMLCSYLLLSFFIVLAGHQLILKYKKASLEEARYAFMNAIKEERNQYIKTAFFQYNSRLSPNTIPFDEKKNWCEQIFLTDEDPNRHHLDSIFQARLVNLKIQASVAVRCTVGDKVTASRPDAFYEKAVALDAVSYKKGLEKEQKITLQPYVYLSYRWLANRWPIYMLFTFWLFGTALFVYKLRQKYRSEPFNSLAAKIDTEQTKDENIPYTPPIKVQWRMLPEDFSFDDKHGILKQDNKEALLSGDSLTYFRSFIRKENFTLTYLEIFELVYGIKTIEISKSDRSRITHGIERLQKQLNDFENIKITLVRGKGYRLEFSPDNILS